MQSILFDVDGVLIHGYTGQTERRRRWDQHIKADLGIDSEVFTQTFIRGVFEKEVLTGRKALLEALEEVLPDVGYRGSPLTVASYWINRDSHLNYQLLDLVRRLRHHKDVRLYVATNQEHMRAFYLWNKLGLENLFDDIFYAARLGVLKPDPLFYSRVMDIIGPQIKQPIIIDDSLSVVRTAEEFGWQGIYYTNIEDCRKSPLLADLLA
ncbi:HAD-IA family hydrolase [Oryzifoliimicrobium ureilyticus]|uniref:HAD-IA family hydrolase n=1 Tax=Oryzifoliimicrobium ureilyticus TaxID=3113724 RepID=UPI00307675B6